MGTLRMILQTMRKFGPDLLPLPGAVLKDRDDDGRCLPVAEWVRAPKEHPPVFTERTKAVIQELGMGSYDSGLEMISRHPSARMESQRERLEPRMAGFQARDTEKLEERWVQAYSAVRGQVGE